MSLRQVVFYDFDVLIDVLRTYEPSRALLKSETRPSLISALVVAELHAGVREGAERVVLDDLITLFEVVAMSVEDGIRGGLFRRDWKPSHGTGLIDAILAAQTERLGAELVTLNATHFPMLGSDAVRVPYRKPATRSEAPRAGSRPSHGLRRH